jgi:hypothetical protein
MGGGLPASKPLPCPTSAARTPWPAPAIVLLGARCNPPEPRPSYPTSRRRPTCIAPSDPAKSECTARERSLPFEIALALFDGPTIEIDDQRRDYGERRIIAYGNVTGRVLVCV